MMTHKGKVVGGLTKGIEGLFKKNHVDYLKGYGKFESADTLRVDMNDGSHKIIQAKHIIIATGSEPNNLPGGILPIDEGSIVSSTGALSLKKVPERLIVIGGGVIGLELGSVYARLGTKVDVVEYFDKILPPFDNEISSTFLRILKKLGMNFHLSTKVVGGSVSGDQVTVLLEEVNSLKKHELVGDVVLVSTGRRPYTAGLRLEKVGITTDKSGRIPVDSHLMTSVPNVYAIGDVVQGPMLAHKGNYMLYSL